MEVRRVGKYKHGKPNEEIDLAKLKKRLSKVHLKLRHRAYVMLLYWVGCRRGEPLSIKKEDLTETNGVLFVNIPAFKGGERGGAIELPLTCYGADIVRQVWQKTKKGRKLFPFVDQTGYRTVKKLFPEKSPHWFRHNRLTKLRRKRDEGKISTDDIKSFTGIKQDATIERYGMKTKGGIHKVAQVLD